MSTDPVFELHVTASFLSGVLLNPAVVSTTLAAKALQSRSPVDFTVIRDALVSAGKSRLQR